MHTSHIRPLIFAVTALGMLICRAGALLAAEFCGKVVSIADGDTITVLFDNEQRKIRLDEIDAPEKKQPFGTRAKQALSEKIGEKEVRIVWAKKDRYGRILGRVYCGDRWINREMVGDGFAWRYVQYSRDPELAKAEAEARDAKRGLWSDKEPIPPWEWRTSKSK